MQPPKMTPRKPLPTPPGADLSRAGTIDPSWEYPGFVVPSSPAEAESPTSSPGSPRRKKFIVVNADSLGRHGAMHTHKKHENESGESTPTSPDTTVVSVAEPTAPPTPPASPPIDEPHEPKLESLATVSPSTPVPEITVTSVANLKYSPSYPIPRGLERNLAAPSSTAATSTTGLSSLLTNVSSAIPLPEFKPEQKPIVGALVTLGVQAVINTGLLIAIMVVHSWVVSWLPTFAAKAAPSSAEAWFNVLVAFQVLMVYHGLFLAAQFVELALLIDSIRSTNTLELLGFFAFQLCAFVYTVVQVFQEQFLDRLIADAWPTGYIGSVGEQVYNVHSILAWTIMAVNAAFVLVWIALARKMYLDWGWRKFRRIGADPAVRRRVWWHQVYVLLLKCDLFFFVGFAVQYINMTAGNFYYDPATGYVAGLSVAASIVVLAVMIVGLFAARLQSSFLMLAFLAGLLAGIGFDCWLFWLIFASPTAYIYEAGRAGMSVFMALALLFALITFAVSVANLFFFIHGPRLRYKELRLEQPARKGSEEQLKKPEPAAVEGQTRWEMD